MEFYTSDANTLADICEFLAKTGCCSRCVLRYAGLKDMYTYRGDTEEMNCLVSKLIGARKKSDTDEGNGTEIEIIADPAVIETTVEQTVQETKADKTTEPMETTETSDCNGTVSQDKPACESPSNPTNMKVGNGTTVLDQKDSESKNGASMGEPKPNWLVVTSSCVVCLGVLEQFTSDDFLNKIKSIVTENGYVFSSYLCSLMIPVCVILREHALILFLKEKFASVYGEKKCSDIAAVKDIWKWKNGPALKEILNAPFDAKSPFEVTLTFNYKNSDQECNFLMDSKQDTFRHRKLDRRHRKKSNFAVFTRANVASAVEKMSDDDFRKNYTCPPSAPSCPTVCDIKCQSEAVWVAGRYNKYSRTLSQTPWMIDGVRKSASSVEELLCEEINKNFKPKEQRFSSSGREDVDVLMLGDGRPFVLELINPCRRDFSQQELNDMQTIINSSTKDIKCRDLQIVTRDEVEILKTGEIDKVKQYRALCWTDKPVTDAQLQALSEMKDLTILQKTPIRVLHRRPLATRDKIIHSMCVTRVDEHHFSVDLSTQAGTYIKEFVHGDLGRTRPNLSLLLDADCDIAELDVKAVELDWPKKIQDQDGVV